MRKIYTSLTTSIQHPDATDLGVEGDADRAEGVVGRGRHLVTKVVTSTYNS